MKLTLLTGILILTTGCATFIFRYKKPAVQDYLIKTDKPPQLLWNNVYVGLDRAMIYEDSSFNYSFWRVQFYPAQLVKADMMGQPSKASFHTLKFPGVDTSVLNDAYCENITNDSFLLSVAYGYRTGGYYLLNYGVKILSVEKLRMQLLTFRNFSKYPKFNPPIASFSKIIYLKRLRNESIEAE